MLRLRILRFSFGTGAIVLDSASVVLPMGQKVAVKSRSVVPSVTAKPNEPVGQCSLKH